MAFLGGVFLFAFPFLGADRGDERSNPRQRLPTEWPVIEPTGNTEVEQAMLQVPKAFGETMATVMHELKVPKAVEEL